MRKVFDDILEEICFTIFQLLPFFYILDIVNVISRKV